MPPPTATASARAFSISWWCSCEPKDIERSNRWAMWATQWWMIGWWLQPLWEIPSGKHTKNYGKSPFFMGKLTISMAIFNSYVSLPEGKPFIVILGLVYWAGLGGLHTGLAHEDMPEKRQSKLSTVCCGWLLALDVKSRSTFTHKWLDTLGWPLKPSVTNDTRPSRKKHGFLWFPVVLVTFP